MDDRTARLLVSLLVLALVVITTIARMVISRMKRPEPSDPERKDEPLWRRMMRALEPPITPRDEMRTHGRIAYRYRIQPGGKNVPPSLTIAIECASHGDFEVRKETRFDRFFKRLGLTVEIQTGDPSFDTEYYIDTSTPDFARMFFAEHRKLAHVRPLFDAGFTGVKHDGKTLAVRMQPLVAEPEEAMVEAALVELTGLASGMLASPSLGVLVAPGWKRARAFIAVASAVIYAAGITCLVLGMIDYPPLDQGALFLDSLHFGIPALCLYAGVCVLGLRGRSGSHKEIAIALGLALAAVPLSVWGLRMFANGYLDRSSPQGHTVVVKDKHTSQSKNGPTYTVVLDSWRSPGGDERITVRGSTYRQIEPRRTRVTVTTRAGYLGFEWLVRYDLE